MSVNISPRQFKQEKILTHIKNMLEEADFPPQNLLLEITETTLFENFSQNISKLHKLKQLGVKLALDDFGTGYSSLNYLKNMPVDIIKVDKSFILGKDGNPDETRHILEGIVNMAHCMELKVIAEGIETREQLALVSQAQCDGLQGFLFSRPLNLPKLKVFLV